VEDSGREDVVKLTERENTLRSIGFNCGGLVSDLEKAAVEKSQVP
jgi:hypothetical protein